MCVTQNGHTDKKGMVLLKFKKLTAATLVIIALLSALTLTVTAEDKKDGSAIPEDIPTESVNLDIEYSVYVGVKPFENNRSFAVAPFSRFCVSKDGSTVILTFPSDSGTAVAVFTVTDGTMELIRGFDIAISETAIPQIYKNNVLIWLKESGVLFAVDPKNELVTIEKLAKDADTENGEPLATTAAEEFFGDGINEVTEENGTRFSPADPLHSNETEAYTKLIMTTADGGETVLYSADTFPALRAPTVALISAVALAIAVAVAITELAYWKKKDVISNDEK